MSRKGSRGSFNVKKPLEIINFFETCSGHFVIFRNKKDREYFELLFGVRHKFSSDGVEL